MRTLGKYLSLFPLLIAAMIRVADARMWNPYWGYDGGSHLVYAETLRTLHRLPTFNETVVAWHEPLFYFLAAMTRNTHLLPLISGILLLTIGIFLACKLLHTPERFFVACILAGSPVLYMASIFFSNEGFGHLWILAAFAILLLTKNPTEKKTVALIILFLTIGLWTKITALIALLVIALWYLWRWFATKNRTELFAALLIVMIPLLCISPWWAYKIKNFGGVLNNPYEDQFTKTTPTLEQWTPLDPNIFISPFFPAGARSFWTVAFASAVTDYDAMLKNPDEKKVVVDHLNLFIKTTVFHKDIARMALVFGFLLLPFFLVAWMWGIKKCWQERKKPAPFHLLPLYVTASIAALISNFYQHPEIERGTVKAFFLTSAIILWTLLVGYWMASIQEKRTRIIVQIIAVLFGIGFFVCGALVSIIPKSL